MSEREEKALKTIANALPNMSDFQKGYLVGMGEAMGEKNRKERSGSEEDRGRRGQTGKC